MSHFLVAQKDLNVQDINRVFDFCLRTIHPRVSSLHKRRECNDRGEITLGLGRTRFGSFENKRKTVESNCTSYLVYTHIASGKNSTRWINHPIAFCSPMR